MDLFHYNAGREVLQVTNEELALLIQSGCREYIPQLWTQVKRFVFMKAGQYEKHLSGCAADGEDLQQSGYFAMMEAVKYYSPEKGYKFITYLDFTLKKAFRQVAGIESSRRDAALLAVSLDELIGPDDNDIRRIDLIEDTAAQAPFYKLMERDSLNEARKIIEKALERVNEQARQLIILIYFEGKSLTEAASIAGYSSRQAAEQAHYNALRKIRNSSAADRLKTVLNDLSEFDLYSEALKGTGLKPFREHWESSTERTSIKHMAYERRKAHDNQFNESI
jgi:RNA polymerase sporulation-specific sigma factor